MGTTSDKLLYLQDTKAAIKNAIVAKGVSVPVGTTFRNYATKIGEITTGGGGSEVADAWVRPTEWLALPDNVDGVQKVSILNAVFDTDSEFVAFTCRGSYTVDWGDGVVENFADNAKAEHKYTYSNVSLNSDTVATFGYKQCIITITPQAGQNLTQISFNQYHSLIGSSDSYDLATGFLDIRINASLCTSLQIGLTLAVNKHSMLEQCLIGELAVTSFVGLFYDCYALQSVSIKDTSNITLFASMHYNNYALQKMPTYTFRSAGVDVSSMYQNCYALRETYPLVITLSGNTIAGMFTGCKSIRYIDLTINSNIDYSLASICNGCLSLEELKLTQTGTGKVTSLSNSFLYTRIKESPAMDTSLCTTFANAFQYCDRLTTLQTYDYSSATTLAFMLDGCYSLKSVPNFNITASCPNLASLCNNCWSLEKAPTFSDSSGVTNIANMLSNCKCLTTIPSYIFGNIAASYGLVSFANGCSSLQVMPSITVGSSYTANTSILNTCYSLKRMLMPLKYTFSVANAKMSADALNEMYSILPTVAPSQTVTVTGNYGSTNTPVVSKTCSTTKGSATILTSNTSGLSVGMVITGTGVFNSGTCTFTDATNTVTKAGHTFVNNDIIGFPTITGTTGILINTIYYVINVATDTFQLSLTQGGSAIDLVTDGSGNYTSPMFVNSIVNNTSITMSAPATATNASVSISFRSGTHKTYLATMKNWTVTG